MDAPLKKVRGGRKRSGAAPPDASPKRPRTAPPSAPPAQIAVAPPTEPERKKTKKEKKRERKAAAALAAAPAAPSDPAEAALRSARADAIASGRRIFVGHLAQTCTEAELRSALVAFGEVAAVDMLTRKPKPSRDAADDAEPDAPTTGRFKGAAFVDFVDASSAAAALALGSLAVCGKEAVLRPAKAAPAEGAARPAPAAGAPGPSVFVSGLPLDASRAQIREAFGGCGEVKRVKLLSPVEGIGARAFVDFHTTAHAGAAVALMGSQVLGRRVAVAYSVKTGGGGAVAAGGGGFAPPKKRKAFQGVHRPACRCPKCLGV